MNFFLIIHRNTLELICCDLLFTLLHKKESCYSCCATVEADLVKFSELVSPASSDVTFTSYTDSLLCVSVLSFYNSLIQI